MATKLRSRKPKYKPPSEELEVETQNDIFARAIASASKHNIEIKPGRKNLAAGNCSYESVIYNINDRPCFKEKLPMTPDYYRGIWTTDMMNKTLDRTSSWNPGYTAEQVLNGFNMMMESGAYAEPFFGDMMMAGIACGVRRRILIFNTNENIISTGHDPIAVVNPKDYGGQVDDENPVVVAYNLTHYESLHPVNKVDIEKTINLTNSYIAQPSRYKEEYGFTTNDISFLVSTSAPNHLKNDDAVPNKIIEPRETIGLMPQSKSENSFMDEKFVFIQGDKRFEEIDKGKVLCGVCKQSFIRIIGHLKNNIECAGQIDLPELKSMWQKFTKKRKNTNFCKKKKAENSERFLKEQANRKKLSNQKKRAENEDHFLKKEATWKKLSNHKKRAENEEQFLKKGAIWKKLSDQKKREENEEQFLKKEASRKKLSDQKKRAENEEQFLKKEATRKKLSYQKKRAENKEKFMKDQVKRWEKSNQMKKQSIDAHERLRRFKKAIRFGPIFVCRCCERKLFEHQVVEVDIEKFKEMTEENKPGLFIMCINSYSKSLINNADTETVITSFDIDKKNYLCKGCKLSMQRGKMPKMSANNGLKVDILPEPNLRLSELENNLIALNIVFQKIHLKPKSRWSGTHDRLVNIPIKEQDILGTLNSLPRTPEEAGLIPVNLKRKLEYKTTHLQQLIDPKKIYKYLSYLKNVAKNKFYQFYDDYNIFIERCQRGDPEGYKMMNPEFDEVIENLDYCQNKSNPEDQISEENDENDELEKEEIEYRLNDPVRKYQFDYDMETCMLPKFPEAIPETSEQETSFAPGEGKVPTNILREDNWDVKSFPSIHPTGKNGLHQKRITKGLTDQQYIEQRLKNQDTRFEQCTPYVFAMTAFIEEKQLERNIGISYSKGKQVSENGERSYSLNDGFAVLDNIKGTPRYWKKAKMEMLAKLDNFGPFHIFYTLSCGDMRWDENFTSILREKGYNIIWRLDNEKPGTWTDVEIKVEFIKENIRKQEELREFLQKEVDESLHEFIRTNVFIATRNFMHRLKTFRTEIMTGNNNPMAIENWSDKMEFQGRGAAHIHGVAWCNLKRVSQSLNLDDDNSTSEDEVESEDEAENHYEEEDIFDKKCRLERAFDKLKMDMKLKKEDEKALIAFADRFTTCTLNPDTAAKMIDETTSITEGIKIVTIAKQTQTHYHTKTCKKYSPDCRFGIPRFPMWKTMLTKPIEGDTAEEISDRKIKHKEVLKTVLEVLEDKEQIAMIWNDYDKQSETKEEYELNRKQRIWRVLELAGVSAECYEAAVREQTRKGVNIILARDIDEMYINNYNPEWIRAWDANMDIQPTFDFFAVITYVTEYFTKDESGTSSLLKMAAKLCSELEITQQKRHLKNTFLKNRQIGISEAFMRILPEFRLKDSTIGTEFLPHGKRADISRFVVRAYVSENHEEEGALSNSTLFKISGRDGLYYEKPNWVNKYFRRGETVKEICPTHLVKMYDPDSKGNKKEDDGDESEGDEDEENRNFAETIKKYGKEAKFHHMITSNGKPGKRLPKYIELENPLPNEPKFLRKRKHPKALRYYKVKEESNPSRYFLQELMFYTSFDEETYDQWHDDTKCIEAYKGKEEEIRAVKKQIMEWLEDVDEARFYVEEALKNEAKVAEIGVIMDGQKQQDDLECEEEGTEEDPLYRHLDLGDHNEDEFLPSSAWHRKIDLKDSEQLFEETQKLDKFQRKTLDIGLKYAKELVKARNHKNEIPEAPNVIILGGAGSGKSTVIESMKQWIEKTLRQPGDDLNTPYILQTATTGAASVIIEGMTLHTAVGLDFSNRHNSLSDKKREIKRDQFKNLKFLITDEFSMMKSDQLYQLDLRLRELKQNNRPFGGVALFLLGDPAQLRPVKGRFSFEQPRCEDYHLAFQAESLWNTFQVVNLTENHRQGKDKTYADILNRIRFGEQTDEDYEVLRKRVRPKNHPDLRNALFIACKKVNVNEHNQTSLNSLPGKLFEIEARHFTKLKQNYKPLIQKDGTISDTQFLNKLQLKIGAKVMLIYNIDVSDLLCNGAMGTLIGVEESEEGNVEKLIIKFVNTKAGRERREKNTHYAKKYPGGTVITKMEREYTMAKKSNSVIASTAKLIQYPVILAFAVTAHKVQGQTIERPLNCVIDLRSVFQGAQAYVMMSRIKELEQLFILEELPENQIFPIKKALDEIKRLQEVSINNNPTSWDKDSNVVVKKVCYLNTRSIVNKFSNIAADSSMQQSDLMILAETWIERNASAKYELQGYNSHLNSSGRGKGLAIFYKEEYEVVCDHNEENADITKIESDDIDVIAIYRSKEGSLVSLLKKIQHIINYSKSTLILGDMNICNKKMERNEFKTFLEEKGFKQIINKATHIDGGHINHAYVLNIGNFEEKPDIELIPKYYSDHDAICISWRRVERNSRGVKRKIQMDDQPY